VSTVAEIGVERLTIVNWNANTRRKVPSETLSRTYIRRSLQAAPA